MVGLSLYHRARCRGTRYMAGLSLDYIGICWMTIIILLRIDFATT